MQKAHFAFMRVYRPNRDDLAVAMLMLTAAIYHGPKWAVDSAMAELDRF